MVLKTRYFGRWTPSVFLIVTMLAAYCAVRGAVLTSSPARLRMARASPTALTAVAAMALAAQGDLSTRWTTTASSPVRTR